MKKSIIFAIFLFLFIFSQSVLFAEDTKRGASIGLTAGAYPFMWNFNSYRFGGEIGYQFTSRIGIMAEFAYAGAKSSYKYSGNSAESSREYTYTSVPMSLSLLFITPVSNNFSTYIGLGVGHYSIKIEEDWTHQSPWLGTESGTEVDKFKEFAPHILFGIETAASKSMIFFGEIRQSVGKTKLKRTSMESTSEGDEHFGGPEIKVGIRFYLQK